MDNRINDLNNMSQTSGRSRRNRKKTLPRSRSGSSKHLIYLTSLFLFCVSVLFAETSTNFVATGLIISSVFVFLLCLTELILRFIYIYEEYLHLITRYENSYRTLFLDVLHYSTSMVIIFFTSFFMYIINYINYEQEPFILCYNMGPISLGCSIVSALFLKRNLDLECGPLYDSLWIEKSNGLDYGSGMAHSFFHGYLKLVIPKTGTSEKHLEELMKDYEDKHHVRLEFYKLFILIPKSLYCPTSLKDNVISPSIEESSSLDPKVITVAGVQNRVYKNSVYKIVSDRGRRVYVCAEYATPLKTFKDVVNYNGEHSNHYKKHKNDIVLQFYLTLQKVLKEHENCTNFCELIFYDDKDENGRYKDVGQILLSRIKKLQRIYRGPHNP